LIAQACRTAGRLTKVLLRIKSTNPLYCVAFDHGLDTLICSPLIRTKLFKTELFRTKLFRTTLLKQGFLNKAFKTALLKKKPSQTRTPQAL